MAASRLSQMVVVDRRVVTFLSRLYSPFIFPPFALGPPFFVVHPIRYLLFSFFFFSPLLRFEGRKIEMETLSGRVWLWIFPNNRFGLCLAYVLLKVLYFGSTSTTLFHKIAKTTEFKVFFFFFSSSAFIRLRRSETKQSNSDVRLIGYSHHAYNEQRHLKNYNTSRLIVSKYPYLYLSVMNEDEIGEEEIFLRIFKQCDSLILQ